MNTEFTFEPNMPLIGYINRDFTLITLILIERLKITNSVSKTEYYFSTDL